MPDPLPIARNADAELSPAAGARQPPRAHHRRHRHRQDRHAAGDGRALQRHRRAGLHGRREGRSCRHQPGRARVADKLAERLKLLGVDAPRVRRRARSCSGTCSASRAIRCARRSPTWARCCSRGILDLNETQEGVLALVFKVADDNGLLLLDLKDLRAMLQYVGDNAQQFQTNYGNVSAASIGAIQRGLLALEQQGAEKFFGEPMLNVDDLLQTGRRARGVVNILAADKLMQRAEALLDVAAVAAVRALRAAARGRRPATSRSSCSSSTRRTCCSPTRRRRCSTRSSRSCG